MPDHLSAGPLPPRRQGRDGDRRAIRPWVALTKALAEAGADLVLAARRADRLEQTRSLVHERSRRALAVSADVSRPEDAQAVVDAAISEFGHVDLLVNNAPQGHRGAGDARDPGAVPGGDRHQAQRLLLDGAGVRPGDAARQPDRQCRQRRRADQRRPSPGGLLGQQSWADGAHS